MIFHVKKLSGHPKMFLHETLCDRETLFYGVLHSFIWMFKISRSEFQEMKADTLIYNVRLFISSPLSSV